MNLGRLFQWTALASTILAGIGPLPATPAGAQWREQMNAGQGQPSVAQAGQTAGGKETDAAEAKTADAPSSGKLARTFRIFGKEVEVRLYGFAKVDAFGDTATQNRSDTLSAQSIALSGTANAGGDAQVTARRSRLGFETRVPVNATLGDFRALLELDLAGQSTNLATQGTSTSYTPRVRKAYVDFGKATGGWGSVLLGQDTTVFGDQSLLPIEWMSNWVFVGLSNNRQGQFRYAYGFADGLSVAFGLESPSNDITTSSVSGFPDANGGSGLGFPNTPDFTGRVQWRQGWGLIALRGVVRPKIELNNQDAAMASARFSKSTTGYGLGVTGVERLLDGRLVLMASVNGGSGIGHYLDNTASAFGAVTNAGLPGVPPSDPSLDPVASYGGMVGLQYFFTPTLRTNIALGGARLIMPSYTTQFGGCVGAPSPTGTCSAINKSEWAGSINLVWSPVKAVDIGFEYQHVERVLQGSFSTGGGNATTGGIANRIQLTGIGRF